MIRDSIMRENQYHIMADSHLHTSFSSDSKEKMEDMVKGALSLGLTDVCFTDHYDKDYPTPEFQLNTEAYMEAVTELKGRYADDIEIRFGVELGLQPHLPLWIAEYTKAYPFDFVIGSMHLLDGKDPYYKEAFNGENPKQTLGRYFKATAHMLDVCHSFDTLGHLDYIARYLGENGLKYDYEDFKEEIDMVLNRLIKYGVALELNTAGYRYAAHAPNPGRQTFRHYKELGGELITIGSDAHRAEDIGSDFDAAAELLKDSGFTSYTVYRKRKPVSVKLHL